MFILACSASAEQKNFITLPVLPDGLTWRVSETISDVFTQKTVITRKFVQNMANVFLDIIEDYVYSIDKKAKLEVKIFQQSEQRAVAHVLLGDIAFIVVDCQVTQYKKYYIRTVTGYICDEPY